LQEYLKPNVNNTKSPTLKSINPETY